MARQKTTQDPVLATLESINGVLQDLLILQCANAGMNKAEVKKIVGGDTNKITRIWKHLGKDSDKE